jgi:hypothetical protein
VTTILASIAGALALWGLVEIIAREVRYQRAQRIIRRIIQ